MKTSKKGLALIKKYGGAKLTVSAAEKLIVTLIRVPLSQNQFDALVSFVSSIGKSKFYPCSVVDLLNAADYDAAAEQFPRWTHAEGKLVKGWTKRRAAEKELFLS